MAKRNLPLSDLLRPQQLGDLTVPLKTIISLQRMVRTGTIMNMMLHGEPGTGKTSAARILISEVGGDANKFEVNGSACNGIEFVRDKLVPFVSSIAAFPGPKICFIDEADFMSAKAQASMRHLIEKSYGNCRWLFTANSIRNIDPAIRSRLLLIDFDIRYAAQDEVINRSVAYYQRRLTEIGIEFDSEMLFEWTAVHLPD